MTSTNGSDALFPDRKRTDPSPSQHGEATYPFLDRVADPVFERIRMLLNAWLAEYPIDHRADLRARLASGDDRQFAGGFWELYLHHVYHRLGWQPEIHPPIAGISKRPDFLIHPPEADDFYLEAAVPGESDTDVAERNRLARIEDSLNQIESPNFFLLFEVDTYGTDSPSVRGLREDLESWLSILPWEQIRGASDADPFFDLPEKTLSTGDWIFIFKAMPKSAELRGQPGVRPIGGGPIRAGWVDDRGPLLGVASRKAKRYGRPPRPLVLALCSDRDFADDDDVNAALFGQPAMVSAGGAHDAWKPTRLPNGLWRGRDGWRSRHVAGVIACHRLQPWSITQVWPKAWLHPEGSLSCSGIGPWTCFEVRSDQELLVEAPGQFDPETHLYLPGADKFQAVSEWPGRPFKTG